MPSRIGLHYAIGSTPGTHLKVNGYSASYLLRNGELSRLSADPDALRSLLEEHRITPEDVPAQYTSLLEGTAESVPHLSLRELLPGDRYLLCTDGLSDVVSAEAIYHVLATQPTVEATVRHLISLADATDNITCVVADVVVLD